MFEKATRNKYRFPSTIGLIDVEDLWDLSIEKLDDVYKRLNKELKLVEEESLLIHTKNNEELTNKVNIVKFIFEIKVSEQEERTKSNERAEKKQYLLSLIQQKQIEADKDKSIEELQRLIDEL